MSRWGRTAAGQGSIPAVLRISQTVQAPIGDQGRAVHHARADSPTSGCPGPSPPAACGCPSGAGSSRSAGAERSTAGDQPRVPAQQLRGETINAGRRLLGRTLASPLVIARSGHDGRGLLVVRRSTATWWRSTRISASFAASERASRTSQPKSRTKPRYSSRTATAVIIPGRWGHRRPIDANGDRLATPPRQCRPLPRSHPGASRPSHLQRSMSRGRQGSRHPQAGDAQTPEVGMWVIT